MDCTCRALSHTLLAELAFSEVDVREIVLHRDGLERTYLGALSAAYAGSLAGLAGSSTLVLVHAADEHTHIPAALVAKFDDVLRAGLHTSPACSTFLLVHDRKSCLRIHGDGTELARSDTVPAAETSERTACVTAVKSGLHTASLISAIFVGTRAVLTRSVAAHYSNLRLLCGHLNAEHGSNLLHTVVTPHRTEALVQVR